MINWNPLIFGTIVALLINIEVINNKEVFKLKKIRIGSGAGYAGDRIEPAIELMKKGNLDYIIFECLAERTISIGQ